MERGRVARDVPQNRRFERSPRSDFDWRSRFFSVFVDIICWNATVSDLWKVFCAHGTV
ncbi:hypothetical protein CCACVL1_07633, partial [Corchorus capsularis]